MVCLPLIVTLEPKSPLHKGGKNSSKLANKEEGNQSDKPYHARSMSWAQRLRRVFNIDITECKKCEKLIAIFASATRVTNSAAKFRLGSIEISNLSTDPAFLQKGWKSTCLRNACLSIYRI